MIYSIPFYRAGFVAQRERAQHKGPLQGVPPHQPPFHIRKEYLRRLSVIWSSPLSDYNRVVASNQFALPVLGYLMWTQHWPVTDLKIVDWEARKIIVENGGKHPRGSKGPVVPPKRKGRKRLTSRGDGI